MKRMGLEKGDRVILCLPKSIEAVVIHLGIQKAGGISVILNPGFKKDEMAYFLEDTDAKIIVVGKKRKASSDPSIQKGLCCPSIQSPLSLKKNYSHPLLHWHPIVKEIPMILLSSSILRDDR